jgi:hypothetical protein
VFGAALTVWPVMLVHDATLGPLLQLADNVAAPVPVAWADLPVGAYRLGILAAHVRTAREFAADIELRAEVVDVWVEGGETAVVLTSGERSIAVRQAGYRRWTLGRSVPLFFALAGTFVFSPRGATLRVPQPEAVAHGVH